MPQNADGLRQALADNRMRESFGWRTLKSARNRADAEGRLCAKDSRRRMFNRRAEGAAGIADPCTPAPLAAEFLASPPFVAVLERGPQQHLESSRRAALVLKN